MQTAGVPIYLVFLEAELIDKHYYSCMRPSILTRSEKFYLSEDLNIPAVISSLVPIFAFTEYSDAVLTEVYKNNQQVAV